MSVRYQGIEYDENNAVVQGAKIYVLDRTGATLQTLTDDYGNSLTNPVISTADGGYYFRVATAGTYYLEHYWGNYPNPRTLEFVAVGIPSDAVFKGDKGDKGDPGGPVNLADSLGSSTILAPSQRVVTDALAVLTDGLTRTRTKQLSATTFYVRTDGNDSHNGLTDSAAGAFATWQAAILAAQAIDFNGYDVIIQAGAEAGVKTWAFAENQIRQMVGRGRLIFRGNGSNTVLNATGQCFSLYDTGMPIVFGNLKLSSAGGYGTIVANGVSSIAFETTGPIFGTAAGSHIFIHDNGAVAGILSSAYTITGNAGESHIWAALGGSCSHEGNTVTFSGTRSFSAFYNASSNGYIQSTGNTFVGSATGLRYYIGAQGLVNLLTGVETDIPGNAAGVVGNGGIFVSGAGSKSKQNALDLDTLSGKTILAPTLYSPTVTADSGTFTIVPTPSLTWSRINNVVTVTGTVFVPAAAIGTATGGMLITLPAAINGDAAGSAFSVIGGVVASIPCTLNQGGNGKIRLQGNPTNNSYYTLATQYHAT